MSTKTLSALILFAGLFGCAEPEYIGTREQQIAAMLAAIRANDDELMKNLFEGDSGDYLAVNQALPGGRTFLFEAADHCKDKAIAVLRERGADPNLTYSDFAAPPLLRAALACSREESALAQRAFAEVLRGADVNAIRAYENTKDKTAPIFFDYARECGSKTWVRPSYAVIHSLWSTAGLKPGNASSEALGRINLLHVAAIEATNPECGAAAESVSRLAVDADFAATDKAGRLPVDYTLGSAYLDPATPSHRYSLDCFAYGRESPSLGVKRQVAAAYEAGGRPVRDVSRACLSREGYKPKVSISDDDKGPFIFVERRLRRNNGRTQEDDPGCESHQPNAWASCTVLHVESEPGYFVLLDDWSSWIKDADPRCPNTFVPRQPPSAVGFSECENTKCSLGFSRMQHLKTERSPSGETVNIIEILAKTWSGSVDRCVAVKVRIRLDRPAAGSR